MAVALPLLLVDPYLLLLQNLFQLVLLLLSEVLLEEGSLVVEHLPEDEDLVIKVLQRVKKLAVLGLEVRYIYGFPHVVWKLPILVCTPAVVRGFTSAERP